MAYNLTYSYNSSSQSYSVTGYSNIATSDKVVIPSTYNDGTNGEHPVTSIGSGAFQSCSSLTSVTIGNGVTTISGGAFYNCSSLTSVTIPESVTSIDSGAFRDCTKLKQLILFPSTPPTLSSIDAIPDNVQTIYVKNSSLKDYKTATNWNSYASKINSNNLYLSLFNFNQENKKYIDNRIVMSVTVW